MKIDIDQGNLTGKWTESYEPVCTHTGKYYYIDNR